ncbi:hypothetical protein AQUCO_00600059v1 [Aquilegia coerulea]|uniref:Uncharacterized protein n=1 Tax=Aquilegia coerulea TaxID=218851 RepID=A0A2G5EMZ2_AQUCA|nr:hypothetical protein AQUCO_00600059v1 [Aquilegia coerulea]
MVMAVIQLSSSSSSFFSTASSSPFFIKTPITTSTQILVPQLQVSKRRNRLFVQISSFNRDNGGGFVYKEENENYDSEEDDDDEEDRSLDLLVKFVQNVFKKISKRARKAVRSVLPVSISTQLVGFSVNGVIILAFLWVLKAFLEVVCTFGSLVFVSILLIRGTWSGISYLQESRNRNANEFDDNAWSGAQPAS